MPHIFAVGTFMYSIDLQIFAFGPLARYVKCWVAHAPGMSGMFSSPPTSKEPVSLRSRHASRHVRHVHTVMHVGIANHRWRGYRTIFVGEYHVSQTCIFGSKNLTFYQNIDVALSDTIRQRTNDWTELEIKLEPLKFGDRKVISFHTL